MTASKENAPWVTFRPEIKVLDCTVRDGGLKERPWDSGLKQRLWVCFVAEAASLTASSTGS